MFLLKFFVSFLAFLLILSYDLVVCCYHFVLLYLLKIFYKKSVEIVWHFTVASNIWYQSFVF